MLRHGCIPLPLRGGKSKCKGANEKQKEVRAVGENESFHD
jgi:hypothetical protein